MSIVDGLHVSCQEAIQALRDDLRKVTRDRDLWKERHDRERAAHAKNLTEQQKVEAERNRLRTTLEDAWTRMDRARNILTDGNPRPECNWGMLDTSLDRRTLSGEQS